MNKRWILLEVSLSDEETKVLENVGQDFSDYIRQEIPWLNASFTSVDVVWITDNYEADVQLEDE